MFINLILPPYLDMVNFRKIEKKWQSAWKKEKIFEVKQSDKKKFYILEMFPYPSGSGLHVGHTLNYTIGDIYARFKILNGFNVLHPMGYDSLGLPAENAAIKNNTHPEEYTRASIKNFIKQQQLLGLTYDWSRTLSTSDPKYYKWDQWIFLKMFEKGLAYKKKSAVNWCPECNSVLANEQVHNGKCWRHTNTNVEVKNLSQWFFKTTAYVEELNDFSKLEQWPDLIKKLQKNWIGKSHGTEIIFKINNKDWPVFTTRPDTLFGVTFLVISAQHSKLMSLVTKEQKQEVEKFIKKLNSVSEEDINKLAKEGVFTGSYAEHPFTKEKIPVYAGNFVLAEYGSGMVMAVPAHDQRDFEFAKKYNIPLKEVIQSKEGVKDNAYTGDGKLINSPIIIQTHKSNCIIVHGSHYSKEEALKKPNNLKHWIPWLKKQLEKLDISTSAELYPKNWKPNYNEWKKVFEKNELNENTILVGHSAGSTFILRWLAENKKKVNKVILVAPTIIKSNDLKRLNPLKDFNYNFSLKNYFNQLTIFYSDNDYKNIIESAKEIHTKLGGDIIHLKGKGHFCLSDLGTEKFPELLNQIQGPLVPIFNRLDSQKAKEEITKELKKINKGGPTINYKLRDWLISRQRYWGTPIPIINCPKCGEVPIPEKDLPIRLPKEVKFGKGNPLETNESFINTTCPKCNSPAKRETDTMDTFVNSSWYYLRYTSPNNNQEIFNKEEVNYFCPIDMYIGGKEHACMHLIYTRFYTKFLRDLGLLNFDEPAIRLFNQGMLHAQDGNKMSKSLGNTVNPIGIIESQGADALRLFLVSVAAPDSDFNWDDKGVLSTNKFLTKIYDYFQKVKINKSSEKTESKLHKTIELVTEDIEKLRYNIAIIRIRELFDSFNLQESKETLEYFLILLNPFCPHLTEELWNKLGNKQFISNTNWPKVNKSKINEDFEIIDRMIKTLYVDIQNIQKLANKKQLTKIKLFVANKWKYELYNLLKLQLKQTRNPKEIITQIMQSNLKQYSKDVMKIIPKIIKTGNIPYHLPLTKEHSALKEHINNLKQKFNCEIEIILADKTNKQKSKQALPGKPAILIE